MPKTKAVIVYSPNQAIRRTVIIPDDDSQIPIHTKNIVPGESVLVVNLTIYHMIGPDAILEQHLGRKRSSDRCVLVGPDGIVKTVICADPAIDHTHYKDGHTLYQHDTAKIGEGYHHK